MEVFSRPFTKQRTNEVIGSNQGNKFNPLQTKCRLLYLKTQSVPRC